jgi:hypothetical protein
MVHTISWVTVTGLNANPVGRVHGGVTIALARWALRRQCCTPGEHPRSRTPLSGRQTGRCWPLLRGALRTRPGERALLRIPFADAPAVFRGAPWWLLGGSRHDPMHYLVGEARDEVIHGAGIITEVPVDGHGEVGAEDGECEDFGVDVLAAPAPDRRGQTSHKSLNSG